jgi:hypothetical protein
MTIYSPSKGSLGVFQVMLFEGPEFEQTKAQAEQEEAQDAGDDIEFS